MKTIPALPRHDQPVHVPTQHNDNARTGANLQETILTPANVNENQFGKLFTLPVDGNVYAQPLYLSHVTIGGAVRNVVFVATQHDSVYAFDAMVGGAPLWHVSFLDPPNVTTVRQVFFGPPLHTGDIQPEIGITGTPVIDVDENDPSQSTLYVVAKTQEVAGGVTSYVQRLHALDVTTGAEKFGGPVVINAEFPGDGSGSDFPPKPGDQSDNDGHGHVLFAPPVTNGSLRAHQRPGLLLLNGVVYVGFASHGDTIPYHGWLLGYDAKTLQLRSVFNTTPNGGRGGIWQGGTGPAADAESIYFTTGNGSFDPTKGNYGDSLVKLSVVKDNGGDKLQVADYFTPHEQALLDTADLDFGSGGVLLLPDVPGVHPPYAVAAGKTGVIFLLDRGNLGKFDAQADHVVQRVPADLNGTAPIGSVFGVCAYFNGSIYYLGVTSTPDSLKQFRFSNSKLPEAATSRSQHQFMNRPSSPSVSANGAVNGIVWIIEAGGYIPSIPATLHAYDARDLSVELYNSDQAVTNMGTKRDQPGIGIKFAVPTIANGRIYVGTKSEVTVYGLLGH